MKPRYNLRTVGIAVALLIAPISAWAQAGGGSDTPRPLGSDPSSRVDQLQGLPAPPIGSQGNPTGSRLDAPVDAMPSNAVPVRPAQAGSQSSGPGAAVTPGSPGAPRSSGTSSPTN